MANRKQYACDYIFYKLSYKKNINQACPLFCQWFRTHKRVRSSEKRLSVHEEDYYFFLLLFDGLVLVPK